MCVRIYVYIYIYVCVCVCFLTFPSFKGDAGTGAAQQTRPRRNHGVRKGRARGLRALHPQQVRGVVWDRNAGRGKKINRSHTHTDRESHPRHRHTHAHDKNNTPNPQTSTSHKHVTTLEGGATTVRITSINTHVYMHHALASQI